MRTIDENELLMKFRLGDRAAFEHVFRLHFNALRLNAYLLLRDEHAAEDIVQQLFLDIWNQQLYRNIQKSLKAYLHTSTRHRCLNHLRQISKQAKILNDYAGHVESHTGEPDDQPSPHLLTILDGLPQQQSRAFHLVHMENKQYQEAAQEMGISINSLKSHLKLAIKFARLKIRTSLIHPYNR